MTETAFLTAVTDALTGAGLAPTPSSIGVAEPGVVADLPSVVLSLEDTERPGSGVGERTKLMTGALSVRAEIDLASPFLPTDPDFRLLSADRRALVLHHGGLVRADGTRGPLEATDVAVEVGGAPRTFAEDDPTGNEFAVDPDPGQVTFGTALPGAGTLRADYFLGQWEQTVSRTSGVLRVDVCAQTPAEVVTLSDAVVAALAELTESTTVGGRVLSIAVSGLSSVGVPETVSTGAGQSTTTMRRRTARLRFLFEHVVDEPESSGGIITSVPVASRIDTGGGPEELPEVMTVTG